MPSAPNWSVRMLEPEWHYVRAVPAMPSTPNGSSIRPNPHGTVRGYGHLPLTEPSVRPNPNQTIRSPKTARQWARAVLAVESSPNQTVCQPEHTRHGARDGHLPRTEPSVCLNAYRMVRRLSRPPQTGLFIQSNMQGSLCGQSRLPRTGPSACLYPQGTMRGLSRLPRTGPSVRPNPHGTVCG